ncbi:MULTISPECIES: hypothetical protein [Leptospira]|uniref:hypothetical protein n=1 Tax=Leptospira TaxID=171 RepID=UPI00036FF720|nr:MULTISPECIES: hypothetical protein [Leptospira]UPY77209.1 hypothetical protein FH581_014860 [Leptospira weilii]
MKSKNIKTSITNVFIWILIGYSAINGESPIDSDNLSYPNILINIHKDINLLKSRYPQLADFTISNINLKSLQIVYEYKCHRPNHSGGWTSGDPDPDGLWLYISLWDENNPNESQRQINTQPDIPTMYIQNRRVTFLILEGTRTNSIQKSIYDILRKNGLKISDKLQFYEM